MGRYITFPELLIWLPLLAGILVFFTKREQVAKALALAFSLVTLFVSISTLFFTADIFTTWNAVNYYYGKDFDLAYCNRFPGNIPGNLSQQL